MGKVCIPVILVSVAYHSYHLCHDVVDTFDAAVTARVVDAFRELVYTEEFVNGCRKLGVELESVVE